MAKVSIEHRGGGYFILTHSADGDATTIAVDPWLATESTGRRKKKTAEAPAFDFVLLADPGEGAFDEVLDVLEGSDAVLIGPPGRCDDASRELGGKPESYMDLVPGESARCAVFGVTAVGTDGGGALPGFNEVTSTVSGVGRTFGLHAEPPVGLTDMLGKLPFMSALSSFRMGSQAKLGYLLSFEGGPNVLVAGEAFVGAPDLAMLDEVSELDEVDVLVAAADGDDVGGLIWGVREMEPKTVVLYRTRDPYGLGSRRPALPIRRFVEALDEDSPDTEVVFLRKGKSHALGA
jgi:hypothetical protein